MMTLWQRRFVGLMVVGVCLGMAACSNSRKDNDAYKGSRALPPLEVPPDLIKPTEDSSTALPTLPAAAPASAPAKTSVAMPPPITTPQTQVASVSSSSPTSASGALHIEKQGAQRWLVVPAPVAQVRQRVKDFLLQKGFSFSKEGTDSLETEWRGEAAVGSSGNDLDAALQAGLQDKYKVRIEAGRNAGASEVTVHHFGLQHIQVDGKLQWVPRAQDSMMEAELLDQMLAFFTSEGTAPAPVSDLPAVRSTVTTDEQGAATLTINERFDHAWRRVGIAWGRGGCVVDDRNRSEGIYNIRLGTAFKEEAKAGFVSRLFGSNGGDPDEQYRIAVKERDDQTKVVVQFPSGGKVFTSIGERILDRLQEKMK